jgi:hypothetical protein
MNERDSAKHTLLRALACYILSALMLSAAFPADNPRIGYNGSLSAPANGTPS